MKGFKPSVKNFSFPTSADRSVTGAAITPAESSRLGQQMVRPHFRSRPATPKAAFAKGGSVTIGDQGNATVQRKKGVVEFDVDSGGKGPLRTGYAKGGETRKGDVKQDKAMIKQAIAKHVATPAPKGHKGLRKG